MEILVTTKHSHHSLSWKEKWWLFREILFIINTDVKPMMMMMMYVLVPWLFIISLRQFRFKPWFRHESMEWIYVTYESLLNQWNTHTQLYHQATMVQLNINIQVICIISLFICQVLINLNSTAVLNFKFKIELRSETVRNHDLLAMEYFIFQ